MRFEFTLERIFVSSDKVVISTTLQLLWKHLSSNLAKKWSVSRDKHLNILILLLNCGWELSQWSFVILRGSGKGPRLKPTCPTTFLWVDDTTYQGKVKSSTPPLFHTFYHPWYLLSNNLHSSRFWFIYCWAVLSTGWWSGTPSSKKNWNVIDRRAHRGEFWNGYLDFRDLQ